MQCCKKKLSTVHQWHVDLLFHVLSSLAKRFGGPTPSLAPSHSSLLPVQLSRVLCMPVPQAERRTAQQPVSTDPDAFPGAFCFFFAWPPYDHPHSLLWMLPPLPTRVLQMDTPPCKPVNSTNAATPGRIPGTLTHRPTRVRSARPEE